MDGPWQTGHKTADEYGRLAVETAKAMRQIDPAIELVACGSSSSADAHLRRRGRQRCSSTPTTPWTTSASTPTTRSARATWRASSPRRSTWTSFIRSVIATADHVGAKRRSQKRVNLSFDEWNVWYQREFVGHTNLGLEQTPASSRTPSRSPTPSRSAGSSTRSSATRTASRSPARPSSSTSSACIRTEPGGPAWRQTIFHPFAQTARLARGTALRVEPKGAQHETAVHGLVDTVDAAATWDQESGRIALFLVNRHPSRRRRRHRRPARLPGRWTSPSACASRMTTLAARTPLRSPTPCGRATTRPFASKGAVSSCG